MADDFGPPQWEIDSVMKTSVTKNFKVKDSPHSNEIVNQKRELEAYQKELKAKNEQIEKLNNKCDEFRQTCDLLHKMIIDFEKISDQQFFTKEQRQKKVMVTHMDYSRILKESIFHILHKNSLLEDEISQEFAKSANKTSAKLVEIRDSIISTRKAMKSIEAETKNIERLYEINLKEKNSLESIVESLKTERDEVDNQITQTVEQTKTKVDKLKEEKTRIKEEAKEKERKYSRIIAKQMPQLTQTQLQRQKMDTRIEDQIIQKEIKELMVRYELDAASYERTKEEYDHIVEEIKRGKEHIVKHRKALDYHELEKAQKVNQDLREYIEKERADDKRKFDSQVKKNKELERTIKEHLEEQSMLKQYLSQLEKKIASQATKLPALQSIGKEMNQANSQQNTIKLGSRFKNDDMEMKLVRRAMSTLSRKKQVSKSLNLPQRNP